MSGICRARTSTTNGWVSGTPGLSTARSKRVAGSFVAPSSTGTPRARSFTAWACKGFVCALSTAVTFAPRDRNNSVAATPLRPRPMTSTFLFSKMNI